jgi:hypothetical protein
VSRSAALSAVGLPDAAMFESKVEAHEVSPPARLAATHRPTPRRTAPGSSPHGDPHDASSRNRGGSRNGRRYRRNPSRHGDGRDRDRQAGEIDWKAKSREWERKAKVNADAAAKLAALEESQKTEAQKLADRAAQAEKERDEARLEALRVKVGAAKKLPADVIDLLKGDTEEELAAHADRLAEHFKAVRPPRRVRRPGAARCCTSADPAEEFADSSTSRRAANRPCSIRAASSRPSPEGVSSWLSLSAPPAALCCPHHHGADLREGVGAVGRAAARTPVPLSINANTAIPVPLDVPTADWVGEAGASRLRGRRRGEADDRQEGRCPHPGVEEVVRTNPGGAYDQLVNDLPTAIARAFDYAAINGKSLRTGSAGPFAEYLAQTPNSVALGTAAASAGGLYNDLMTGVGKVIDNNYDFTGFAADKRLLVDAALSNDTVGRPIFIGQDTAVNAALGTTSGQGTLAGLPAAFSQGVSGKYWRQGDKTQTATISGSPDGRHVHALLGWQHDVGASRTTLRRRPFRPRSAPSAASTRESRSPAPLVVRTRSRSRTRPATSPPRLRRSPLTVRA